MIRKNKSGEGLSPTIMLKFRLVSQKLGKLPLPLLKGVK